MSRQLHMNKRKIGLGLIGIALGKGMLYGINPMCVGFFLCLYGQTGSSIWTSGILLGLALSAGIMDVIKYGLVFLTSSMILHLLEYQGKRTGYGLIAGVGGCVTFCMASVNTVLQNQPMNVWLLNMLEGILVVVCVFLFQKGTEYMLTAQKGENISVEEMFSIGIMAAFCLLALPAAVVPENLPYIGAGSLDIALLCIYVMLLYVGYRYSAGHGAVIGAICGIFFALDRGDTALVGILCILGICVGMFRDMGKIRTGIAFLVTGISLGFLYYDTLAEMYALYSMIMGVILFWCIPSKYLDFYDRVKEAENYKGKNVQQITKKKFREFSESLSRLSGSFSDVTGKKNGMRENDMDKVFEELSLEFCKDCEKCRRCWGEKYEQTAEVTRQIFLIAKEQGHIQENHVPIYFLSQCIHSEAFLAEANKSLEIARINQNWQRQLEESREAVAGQLREVAKLVKEFATEIGEMKVIQTKKEEQLMEYLKLKHVYVKQLIILENKEKRQEIHMTARMARGRCMSVKEIAGIASAVLKKPFKPADYNKKVLTGEYESIVLLEDTKYKVLTGVARSTKNGESISGDSFSFLELDSGEMIMILSDGMGSGEEANKESEAVVTLLEQFMEAGFREEGVIRLINSIYVMQSESRTFSTIDMGIVNRYTGICDFIKMGAAAAYIKGKERVEMIESDSLPAGMFQNIEVDCTTKILNHGDYIIMMTDGVPDCFRGEDKEEQLAELVRQLPECSPQELAKEILRMAKQENGNTAPDDMTVLVAGLWEKTV